jgi:hypothetical protein
LTYLPEEGTCLRAEHLCGNQLRYECRCPHCEAFTEPSFKQIRFNHCRFETLAGMSLEIEDELKQKEFAEPIGALYSAQDNFHSKIAALIESYEAKCDSLRPPS